MPELDYSQKPLANIFVRWIARFIDFFISVFVMFFSWISVGLFTSNIGNLSILIFLGYYLLKDALPGLQGQSFGKKAMNIKVIDVNTNQSLEGKYARAILREIVTLIPLLNFIDAIFIFGPTSQRLGDKFAETKVISL